MATNALRNAQSIEKALDLYNSANPDPATRTMEVGLWGAPRSGAVEQSTVDSSDKPSPVSSEGPHTAPNPPSIPTPTAPPSTPPVPTPSAPSVGGSSPDNGSAPLPSTPPVPQAPSMPTPQGSGAPPSAGHGSAGIPSSLPGPSGQQASPFAATQLAPPVLNASSRSSSTKNFAVQENQFQAASGTGNGERAPVSRAAQNDRDPQSPSAPTTRTGDNDVR